MVQQRICVIGGGINGLMAQNVLLRAGHRVTLLERAPRIGGGGRYESVDIGGRTLTYQPGATVLGLMQRFVFEESGLAARVPLFASPHPNTYMFLGERKDPIVWHRNDSEALKRELEDKCGETGDLEAFEHDEGKVVAFLQECYRAALVPTETLARCMLGDDLTDTWVTGSLKGAMDRYFTSPMVKVIAGKDAYESCPIDASAPYTALNVPLTDSGSVLGGRWGYVAHGIGNLLETLADINRGLGGMVLTGATVIEADASGRAQYMHEHKTFWYSFDHIVFATDPLSAARMVGDASQFAAVSSKKFAGTSGKLVMLFSEPAKWKHDTGATGYDSALKFHLIDGTPEALQASSDEVRDGRRDFSAGYLEIYHEGAGMRAMGIDRGYDSIGVFFKHLAHGKRGDELGYVHETVREWMLSNIANPESFLYSKLLTPRDLSETFGFPQGNINHMMLCEGQNLFDRGFSDRPYERFYRFGNRDNMSYCGAGSFPCGSITGTPGYMCAAEWLRHQK